MAALRSTLDPDAPDSRANTDAMRALVDDLRARQRALAERGAAGDDRSIARHRERGKLPVRERIDRLFRRSALMREKWDSPRGLTTYGGLTIEAVLRSRRG